MTECCPISSSSAEGGAKGSTKKNDATNEYSAVALSIRTRKRDLRMASSGSLLQRNLARTPIDESAYLHELYRRPDMQV